MVEENGLKIPSLNGEKVRDHCHFTGKYRVQHTMGAIYNTAKSRKSLCSVITLVGMMYNFPELIKSEV